METKLSICILFFNKVSQTIECVKSFLPSGCPIVVLDNGSNDDSTREFRDWHKNHSQVRLLRSEQNLGVSGGRNLLIQQTTEDWLFFVDNDIVVREPDWFAEFAPLLDSTHEALIPSLFNKHDESYNGLRKISVEKGNASLKPAEGPLTNSFPGGASLVRRSLFDRLGGYDEEMFVGGEDFELALRAELSGEPVRASSISGIELIHDHRPAQSATEKEAVLVRYDKKSIGNSYRRIEEKHGVTFADGWEGWVDKQVRRQVPLDLISEENDSRPHIALVSDVRDWAFHNIAVSLQKNLGQDYRFEIFYLNEYFPDLGSAARDLFTRQYDLVHFLSRQGIPLLFTHLLRRKEGVTDEVLEGFVKTPLTFSIYSHCQLSTKELQHLKIVFNYLACGYTVGSERLATIYQGLSEVCSPAAVIEDGVDLGLFQPMNRERTQGEERPLVAGWAGNSRWGTHVDGLDHKGLHSIIKPALEKVQQQGEAVVGSFCDSSEEKRSHGDMARYYNELDIYLCASDCEGTPNPILEAMACGLPVVTTDVGIVPQLFGPLQKNFIVKERTVDALAEKVLELAKNPELRAELSRENLQQIRQWTREVESRKWTKFFSRILESCRSPSSEGSGQRGRPEVKQMALDFPWDFMFEEAVNDYLADSLSWKVTAPLRKVHFYFNAWMEKRRRKGGGPSQGGNL